ncbi:MAG: phosphatidylinositol-specific phospholipase C domain-containing protein [Lachnospiraceae bacterium]|nr:phosphatidylinositol-specific phospholipase C domain-containing protein [Lachnospiraceae bacterium]
MKRMGKRIRKKCGKIISFMLVAAMICTAIGIVPAHVHAEETNPWDNVSAADWMANLDDNTKLSAINLPGTHDSATQYVSFSSSAQCQNISIEEQLNSGIRFLDLRLGKKKKLFQDEGTLKLVHGKVADCYEDSGNKTVLMLDKVLQKCYDFLDAHSTETIVVSMKMDDGSFDKDVDFANRIYEKYITDDVKKYWFLQNGNPTLSQVRGKIVLVRRYYNTTTDNDYDGNGIRIFWGDQGGSTVADTPWAGPANVTRYGWVQYCVQDRYEYSDTNKWTAIEKGLESPPHTTNQKVGEINITPDTTYFLNFMSVANGSPSSSANTINNQFLAYNNGRLEYGKNYGWIIMDFATKELARHVFETNIYIKKDKDYVKETIAAVTVPDILESDLLLPTTGEAAGAGKGASITWSCEEHPELIKTYGSETWLVRPVSGNVVVNITAKVSFGNYSEDKVFSSITLKQAGVDFEALRTAISKANQICNQAANAKYNLSALKSAIASAEELLKNNNATAEQINETAESLNAASSGSFELKNTDQLKENLLGWYPLTADSNDISGKNNHGTAKGVTFSSENGAAFTGNGKLQSVILLPTAMFNGREQMTISFWAKDTGTASDRNQAVFGFGSGTDGDGNGSANVFKYLLINTNYKDSYLKAVVTVNTWRDERGFKEECKYPKNTWAYITCVFDGTNFTLYKDGQLVESKNTGIKLTDFGINRVAYIGNSIWGSNDNDYIGNVKDFRIYDCAIAAEQAAELYSYKEQTKENLIADLTETLALDYEVNEDGSLQLYVTNDSLDLPAEYGDSTAISWDSSNPNIINPETGAVTIPDTGTEDITLTATITFENGEKLEVIFHCSVFERNNSIDISALKTAIAEIEQELKSLRETDYTVSSWQALQEAIADAKQQVFKPVSAEDVEDAKLNLQEKKAALSLLGDKTALNTLIQTANALNKAEYTTESWQNFSAALNAANETAADSDASQDDVEHAKNALQEAVNALVKMEYTITFDADNGSEATVVSVVTGNKVTKPEAPHKEGYTFAGWYVEGSETEFDFTAPITGDTTLIAKWTEKQQPGDPAIDTSDLETVIADIEQELKSLKEEDYTVSSWRALQKAVEDAKRQVSEPTSTEDVEYAKSNLQEKKAALELLGDKTALNDLIQTAGAFHQAEYTTESWQNVSAALENAKETAADSDASQDDVDSAKNALQEALDSLEKLTYAITFDADNGSTATIVSVKTGNRVTKPENPQKEGYTFAGWYLEGSKAEFDFQTLITSDITLKAKWTVKQNPDGSGSNNPSSGSENNKPGIGSGDVNISPISIAQAKVTVAKAVYNGKQQKPKVSVTYQGTALVQNQDYTVSYSNSKKVGQGTVTVKGIGKYNHVRTVKFNILPKKNKVSKLTNKSGRKLAVKFSKSVGAKGYIVYYATNQTFKSAKKLKTTKTTCTLKGLKKGKTYYIRVRAYAKAGKKTVYSDYSKTVKKKIKK